MIHSFNISNAAEYGDLLVSQHKLRYKVFRQKLGWSIPDYEGMEFDQYDNLRTKYLVYVNASRHVLASLRIYPTSSPYMLEQLWPQLISKEILPKNKSIIDTSIVGNEKQAIIDQMIKGLLILSLEQGFTAIVGIMHPRLWRSVFVERGWDVELLGQPTEIQPNEIVVAGRINVNSTIHLYPKSKQY
jgi:acyl homoserine lactone synthase